MKMAKKKIKKPVSKRVKKAPRTTRTTLAKRNETLGHNSSTPQDTRVKSGSVWSGEGWDAAEGRTYSEGDLPTYTLPTPEYTPVVTESSEFDRVVSQIEPYCKKYLKFSLTETVEFVKAKWRELKKFSEDNPITFGIGFVVVFAVLIGLIASL
jgi:hypothetical protein